MTKQLERVFNEAKKLPVRDQNSLARRWLEELASEKRWARLFASSGRKLAALENEVLEARRRGETKELNLRDL